MYRRTAPSVYRLQQAKSGTSRISRVLETMAARRPTDFFLVLSQPQFGFFPPYILCIALPDCSFTLKMEAAGSSEKSVHIYQNMRPHIQEIHILNLCGSVTSSVTITPLSHKTHGGSTHSVQRLQIH
jgi:hypothetical protein